MKNYKINWLFIILFLCFNSLHCQEKTLYEKKVEELTWQFYENLGISPSEIDNAKKIKNLDNLNVLVKKLFTTNAGIEKFNFEMLILSEGLKKAEALKTEFERKKIESIKNEKKELEEFNKSDYSTISKKIKIDFEKWLSKSEFEKESAFNQRLTNNSQTVFDSICYLSIQNSIKNKLSNSKKLELEIGSYDAEKEYFNIKIKLFNTEIIDTLNIKLSLAKKFKNNQNTEDYITIPKRNRNWFISNNNLFPKELIFTINDKKYFKNIKNHLQNIKLLNFTTKNLDINNNLDLSFDYFKHQKEVESNRLLSYTELDLKPYPQKGMKKFSKYLYKNLRKEYISSRYYPEISAYFTIEKDGSITSIKFRRTNLEKKLKEAIVKVLESSPKWVPGELKGVKVRCRYGIRIDMEY
jgi:hypothetical protein